MFTFGFTTASGASSSVKFSIAGGLTPYEFFTNVDGKGTVAVLIANNRGGGLYAISNCRLVPVTNPQGQDYYIGFDAGEGGNGLGCSTVAGATGQTLVGLAPSGPVGKPTGVTRTQIIIYGTHARNGLMDTVKLSGEGAAAKAASDVSCGNLTPDKDAVRPTTTMPAG